tara:strand:+ start:2338 stop:3786 length:1449 start_codon:yes stop_codon:yes gene_type:complete
MAEEQYSSQTKLQTCVLFSADGSKKEPLTSDMIASFTVYENLLSPFMAAEIIISDSKNLLNGFPIQGGENIEIKLKTTFSEKPKEYKFKIYKISGRIVKNKKQLYMLSLISSEALLNEAVRVQQKLEGNPEAICKKLLGDEFLKSTKEFYSEPSRFEIKMNACRQRPFDIIAKLLSKSVSSKTDYAGLNSVNTSETAQQIKGSAGFFFWETHRGFNFFSVDALCDVSENGKFIYKEKLKGKEVPRLQSQSWGPYIEGMANTRISGDQRFLIENVVFNSEVDLMSSLRHGKYSTLMVFFNYSTGQYEEYVYKIKDSYDNMAHLGGQESVALVPANQVELSDFPTRIMSMVLDHESWYNDPGIANPEDPQAEDPTKFADWQKFYSAQSTVRSDLLKNQEAAIQIPGNPDICAGDKITIHLQSKISDALKNKQPLDEESSGVYLVKETTQSYNFMEGSTGTLKTTLRLFRDSYGMTDVPSNHGNK